MEQRRLAAAHRLPKRAGCTKKVHGHSLLGLSRGTNAAELRFCSWKVLTGPLLVPYTRQSSQAGRHSAAVAALISLTTTNRCKLAARDPQAWISDATNTPRMYIIH